MNKKPGDFAGGDGRRRLLLGITSTLGGAAAAASAVPLVATMRPSRQTQAQGGAVEIDLSGIKEGELRTGVWRLKPIWALRRSEQMLAFMQSQTENLSDVNSEHSLQPSYCKNETRSIKPEFLIAVGLCTHLGCLPKHNAADGFLCACHGSRFDFAGRVLKGSPAPKNLVIPPHHYAADNSVVIGADKGAA